MLLDVDSGLKEADHEDAKDPHRPRQKKPDPLLAGAIVQERISTFYNEVSVHRIEKPLARGGFGQVETSVAPTGIGRQTG